MQQPHPLDCCTAQVHVLVPMLREGINSLLSTNIPGPTNCPTLSRRGGNGANNNRLLHNTMLFSVPALNHTSQRDVLEFSYIGVGPINTTVRWRYSSLTCHPSVFSIQWYTTPNPDQLDTPLLMLNSTSSGITFPTNITNGSLYWRLLAHEGAGILCARDVSANRYYLWDTNSKLLACNTSVCNGGGRSCRSHFIHCS
jgi:hypothetical protein